MEEVTVMSGSSSISNETNTKGISKKSESELFNEVRREYLAARQFSSIREKLLLGNSDRGNRIISENTKSIYEITFGHSKKESQPPVQYRIAFVKYLIKQLELESASTSSSSPRRESREDDYEEDDENRSLWYDALESLTQLGIQSEPFYRLYELPGDHGIVKVFENETAFVAEGTTGLVTWEASLELSKWLCNGNEEIKVRKWIFELGCGCGLLAVTALKVLPHLSKYLASDGSVNAVVKCKVNVEANFGTLKSDVAQVEQIDWVKDGEKFKKVVKNLTEVEGPGILLGADIVFDPALIPSLVQLIHVFLKASEGSVAFLACTLRNAETLDILISRLAELKIKFYEIYKWGHQTGIIYRLTI